jgi:hypothetical protein
MATELNITGDPLEVEVKEYQIEGTNYIIHSWYSDRGGWQLSIYDKVGTKILTGLNLISEPMNLTWRYSRKTTPLFKGDLFLLNKDSNYEIPLTKSNFGQEGLWGIFHLTQQEQKDLDVSRR